MSSFYREITPLTASDCFTVFSRHKEGFDFPLHYHDEMELNFIENAPGAKRIIGDHVGMISGMELVLVGPNVPHGWFSHECTQNPIYEITLQFHRQLFDERLLQKNQLADIRRLLSESERGILFSADTARKIKTRLESLIQKNGFESILELFSIVHELSLSEEIKVLASHSSVQNKSAYQDKRLEVALEYMQANYQREITLEEVARVVNMAKVSFSRYIKRRTGRTYIDTLNDIRLSHASRKLMDSSQIISEIAYACGFNNLSYFNRVFKRRVGYTPKAFREQYKGTRTFI